MSEKRGKYSKVKVGDARTIFEQELARRKLSFQRTADGRYALELRGGQLTVSLENIARDFERDHDATAITRFVERCMASAAVPGWGTARNWVYFSAEPSDHEFGDTLRTRVTDTVTRVLVVTDAEETKVTWLTPAQQKKWKVKVAELEHAAGKNLDALLHGKKLEVTEAAGKKLGMIPVASAFKASLIFAPGFRKFVEPEMGWPVLAVIPCRDFIYVLAEADRDLLGRMGVVVQREFSGSGYPITKEVLRVSDDGIEAIGTFP